MKKLFLAFFLIMMVFSLQAQSYYKINENSYHKINITFTFGDLQSVDIQNEEGVFSRIFMDNCGGSKNIGEPELPVSVNMLEIPIFEDYTLNIKGNIFEIYDAKTLGINHPVYPAQPSVSKSHDGPVDFIQNKNRYQTDEFYALPLAHFEENGIMRNVNLGTLYVAPVQYNPVTNEVKVYKEIEIEIIFNKTDLVKTQSLKDLHKSPLFQPSHTINKMESGKSEFSNTPIKYLIVAHEMFRGILDEFIMWKKRKGFLVEIAYTDDENVGTTTESIATYIKSFYTDATPENPAPTFVLLVGDVEQIPAFDGKTNNHVTDLYYFTWAEESNFPCCYYGRFSAQNLEQLLPQIEKTLMYEQYSMPNSNYLNNISLIAGYDAVWAATYSNGFVNYVTKYYANTEYGYTTVNSYLHPLSSNFAAQIRTEIGAGVGIANYTAHCSPTGWNNPAFNTSHIKNMNNRDKYGLMIGSCCESNKFNISECFGEALLRAPQKGAVGYIGASNLTYWDEDYYWGIGFRYTCTANPSYYAANLGAYDRLYHTHEEPYNKWMTTFGSIVTAGNEAVQASTTDIKEYYWEIYNLMGDPSVMPYLKKPAHLPAELLDFDVANLTLTVKVVPYTYCALTDKNTELISAGFADETGIITLNLDPNAPEEYEFSAWAQNYIQYITQNISVKDYPLIDCEVYPNPTTGELRIENGELKMENVDIFDIYGRKQNAESRMQNAESRISDIGQSEIVINISDFAAGIYFVRITTEKGVLTKKVIKL